MDDAGEGRYAVEVVQAHGWGAAEEIVGVEDNVAERHRAQA